LRDIACLEQWPFSSLDGGEDIDGRQKPGDEGRIRPVMPPHGILRRDFACLRSPGKCERRCLRRFFGGFPAGLVRPVKRKKVTWPQARAFSVHLLTASGSFLAFLSLVAASEERWPAMFWWLGLALFVDGIDGPIARKLEVKEILPTWSGIMLDNIIDYVTYVLIPAFALYQRGFMGPGLSFTSAAIIVITSAIYYADTGMKTKENFFKGFPVVWNMLVFTLFVIEPGEYPSFAAVVVAAILTFVPMHFLHPVRVRRLREINLPIFLVWCLLGVIALLEGMEAPPSIKVAIAITGIYLFFIGGVMQAFPKLGLKGDIDDEGDPHP
jgi:phosphatidylcholine synthase